jgi:hypothetical protein
MSDDPRYRHSRPSPGLGVSPGALFVSLMVDSEEPRRKRTGRRWFPLPRRHS